MDDKAVEIIREYVRQLDNMGSWQKRNFQQMSYSRFIANEILKKVLCTPSMTSIAILDVYIKKLDRWSCVSADSSWMFSTMRDTAMDIYDRLL